VLWPCKEDLISAREDCMGREVFNFGLGFRD